MGRCPHCGKFIKDELTHKEQFKSTFIPRNHGHGASNHGDEELHELYEKQSATRELIDEPDSGNPPGGRA